MKHIFPALILYMCTFSVYAQQAAKPCRPKVRDNKNVSFAFDAMLIRYHTWQENGKEIKWQGDSVTVRHNGRLVTGFKVKGNDVAGTGYVEYFPDGKISQTDSLAEYGWHSTYHYGGFWANTVYTRSYYAGGSPSRTLYYRKNGEDSLRKAWYPNGVLKETVWYYPSGYDSARYEWNTDGVLLSAKTPFTKKYFYPSGILQTVTKDTLMYNRHITRNHAYYATGTLKSVTYFCGDIPCHTWLYYTPEGMPAQTLKNTPITDLPELVPGVKEIPGPVEAFTYVERFSEFPGGERDMMKYVNKWLAQAVCQSPKALMGVYGIRFMVQADGTVTFENITGQNAEVLRSAAEKAFNQMPKWKPAIQHGRRIGTAITLNVIAVTWLKPLWWME